MLQALKLLMPALVPSWRFFDAVGPSPRIEYRVMAYEHRDDDDWREFRPRPAHIGWRAMLGRMVWNPQWNETLFMVSCAERLIQNPTLHSQQEIWQRIADTLEAGPSLQFRLALVSRQGAQMHREIAYVSPLARMGGA